VHAATALYARHARSGLYHEPQGLTCSNEVQTACTACIPALQPSGCDWYHLHSRPPRQHVDE
jgi:hypothetical protein